MDLANNPDVVNFFASFDSGSYWTILLRFFYPFVTAVCRLVGLDSGQRGSV